MPFCLGAMLNLYAYCLQQSYVKNVCRTFGSGLNYYLEELQNSISHNKKP